MAENETKIKKPIYKKWWFWLIVIIVVIALASGSSNNESKTTLSSGNTSENSNTASQSKTSYNVGDIYEDRTIAIKYVSLDDNFKGYSQYADVKGGYKIIKADFEFENVGTSDTTASSFYFNCYADGYDCESFWFTDDSSFTSTLSAGKKAKGSVYFQVPADAEKVTLEYETNMWTSNKVIFNVK